MPKALKVLVAGYYGYGNLGDEAILQVILQDLRHISDKLEVTALSGNPASTQKTYGISAVASYDLPAIITAARNANLILLGGGGIFHDYWDDNPRDLILSDRQTGIALHYSFAFLAGLLEIPSMAYGIGIGPITHEENRKLVREALSYLSAIAIRDHPSLELASDLGFQCELSADPAFRLEPDRDSGKKELDRLGIRVDSRPLVGICLRNWDRGRGDWQEQLAAALGEFKKWSNARLLFIPFQNNPDQVVLTDDVQAAKSVVNLLPHSDDIVIAERLSSPQQVSGMISQCDLIIGMRLHSLIFAASHAVPAVSINYDPKVAALMQEAGLGDYAHSIADLTGERLLENLKTAWERRDELHSQLHGFSAAMYQRSLRNRDILNELVYTGKTGQKPSQELVQDLLLQQSMYLGERAKENRDLYSNQLLPIQDLLGVSLGFIKLKPVLMQVRKIIHFMRFLFRLPKKLLSQTLQMLKSRSEP